MDLIEADRARVVLSITPEEVRDLCHIVMTANLTFDELDNVPYDPTREGVSDLAAFLEEAAETQSDRLELTRTRMTELTATLYTMDISFYAPDGNPFELTQALISDYARRTQMVQRADHETLTRSAG